jgi:hypothetical protein
VHDATIAISELYAPDKLKTFLMEDDVPWSVRWMWAPETELMRVATPLRDAAMLRVPFHDCCFRLMDEAWARHGGSRPARPQRPGLRSVPAAPGGRGSAARRRRRPSGSRRVPGRSSSWRPGAFVARR